MRLDSLDLKILRALYLKDEYTSTGLAKEILPDNGQSLQARDSKMRHRLQVLQPLVAFHMVEGRRHWTLARDKVFVGKLTADLRERSGKTHELRLGESILVREGEEVFVFGLG